MKFFFVIVSIFLLVGCASQEKRQQTMHAYYECVANESKRIDDLKSNMGDLAMAAIYSCSQYEDDIINLYGGEYVVGSKRPKLQRKAYAIAVKSMTDSRKIPASQSNSVNPQTTYSCNMAALYESCYIIGKIKKSESACASISVLQKSVFEKSNTSPEILENIQWLCAKWCGDGILEVPMMSQNELCS